MEIIVKARRMKARREKSSEELPFTYKVFKTALETVLFSGVVPFIENVCTEDYETRALLKDDELKV